MRTIWALFLLILKKDNTKSYVWESMIRLIHQSSLRSLKDLQSNFKIYLTNISETIYQHPKFRIKPHSKIFKKLFLFLKFHLLLMFQRVKMYFKNSMNELFENIRPLQKDVRSQETLLISLNWTSHFIFKNIWKAYTMPMINSLMSST